MKICIIGAGISGLSIAQMLSNDNEVTIFEQDSQIGGIAKVRMIENIPYHTVGGHCFNSRNKEVINFVFSKCLPENNWHKVERIAQISFKNNLIDYPIEFSIPQIKKIDENLAFKITNDFFNTKEGNAANLEDWFISRFGKTLAYEYFIPYNKKIWGQNPRLMSPDWVKGKLPIPNKMAFFNSLFGLEKDKMPHSTFYYPNSNTQNTFIECLARNLSIKTNYRVSSIERKGNKWLINNEKLFDIVISTMPLNVVGQIVKKTPCEILEASKKLKYNKVTNMLWRTKKVDATWTYYPEESSLFHRVIHIGNFLNPKQNYSITESVGVKSYEIMKLEGEKIDYLLEPIDYNVSDYAYVVYDENYKANVSIIKDYLDEIGIYTLGRFGEWAYYNMDICIESAMKLAKRVQMK
jgi:protoporphyrinogen oxidase